MKENEQRVLSTAAGFGAVEEVEAVGEHVTFALPRELRACRLVQARRKVNSSAARLRRLRTGPMTARSAGRAIVTSPTLAECQAPHS
jgi:hypothetical protein